ncbi:MAG TPA: SUF system NifU family Fe-S cluster assembly protein [Thermoanaerobaculia bacterium]|nr:SUF system NifU family Fe-S cluster assembly protein [Thermoanaerobaculia bacterium]
MSSDLGDLRELYQEVILDHNRCPRNFRRPAGANRSAQGNNPLCGDRVTVFLQVEGDCLQDVAFEGAGCAISTASASMMTEAVRGKTLAEARQLFRRFHALLTTGPEKNPRAGEEMGKLEAFTGVREFPTRVKCATLAWHALQKALDEPDEAR